MSYIFSVNNSIDNLHKYFNLRAIIGTRVHKLPICIKYSILSGAFPRSIWRGACIGINNEFHKRSSNFMRLLNCSIFCRFYSALPTSVLYCCMLLGANVCIYNLTHIMVYYFILSPFWSAAISVPK